MWKIDKCSDGQATILRISGRIQSACLRELQTELRELYPEDDIGPGTRDTR